MNKWWSKSCFYKIDSGAKMERMESITPAEGIKKTAADQVVVRQSFSTSILTKWRIFETNHNVQQLLRGPKILATGTSLAVADYLFSVYLSAAMSDTMLFCRCSRAQNVDVHQDKASVYKLLHDLKESKKWGVLLSKHPSSARAMLSSPSSVCQRMICLLHESLKLLACCWQHFAQHELLEELHLHVRTKI